MKANELRIGNFVSDIHASGKFYAPVKKLDFSRCYYGAYHSAYRYLTPIPLTEEWLIRFGFVKMGNEQEFGMNKYFVCKRFGKYEMCQGIEYNSFTKPFEFVHSLQNLYFALTGKELTLKS